MTRANLPRTALTLVAVVLTTVPATYYLVGPPAADPAEPVIRWTAWAAVGWWAAAHALPVRPTTARLLFTLGWWQFVGHVALAFHLGHGWSHADAVARVEAVSGFGPGIWVSHLFLMIWTAEVAWMWLGNASYRDRPRWLAAAVFAFMAFIVFNATVVYGSWPARLFGMAIFAGIAWRQVLRSAAPRG